MDRRKFLKGMLLTTAVTSMPYGHRKKTGKLHSTDWKQWPREAREKLYQQYLAEEALERSRELESQGWFKWYSVIFGDYFTTNLADHHQEALEWHWDSIMRRRAGLKPERDAYFAIWPRGHRKSGLVRAMVAADACLSSPGYCLYTSGTKAKVREHASSVTQLVTHPRLIEYYPAVGRVALNNEKRSRGWTAELMISDAGYTYHYIGLEQGVAGANVDEVRPTFLILDDCDDRSDSPLISDNKLHTLTRSVLPTGQKGTLTFVAQNYISRHGCIYRIHTGKENVLTNRVATKPIPAFYNLTTEPQLKPDGIIHDVITGGKPSWPHYDIERGQEEIDRIGLPAFIAELQHDVDADKSELILPEYDENVHLVHWEEFNAKYGLSIGNRECPAHWRRYVGHDWASTGVESGHACVVMFFAVAAQNSPLAGTVFIEKLMSFPASTLSGVVAHRVLDWVLRNTQTDPRRYIELGLLDRATGDPSDLLAAGARKRVQEELSELSQTYCMWHMSHEAKSVRDLYRIVYGLPFQACRPKKDEGIAQIQQHLRTDYSEPHPFRTGANGYSRMYLLADGMQRGESTQWFSNDDGLKLLRDQWPEWRWREMQVTSSGVLAEQPMKLHDDVGNSAQMVFMHFRLAATPLTARERIVASIPEELRYETLLANSPFEHGLTPEQELSHLLALRRAKQTAHSNIQRFDDYGQPLR